MRLLDESLLVKLPEGVLGMRDANYPITYLSEDGGEIVCDMEIGSDWNNAYDWTFYVGESQDIRIRFEAVSGSDTTLRDWLTEKGIDLDRAYTAEARIRDQFESLIRTVKNISGNTLSFSHSSSEPVFEFWDITIDRNASTEELIDLAMAVDSFAEYSTREINI